ncbi:MAG: hypothetical protein NTW87_24175, partial [Planctomycetota bacterium]|nr:hypothetical protein [Planctomycetota bacterium]
RPPTALPPPRCSVLASPTTTPARRAKSEFGGFGSSSLTSILLGRHTLDSKGRGKSGASTFKLAAKMKKGVLRTQTVQFQLKAAGDLQRVLDTAGLASGTSGNVTLQVQFAFSGKVYAAAMPLSVKGTPKSAAGK